VTDDPTAVPDAHPDSRPARRLARLDAIADGALLRCLHDGSPILLCRVGDDVHAVSDACTHEDVSLSLGALSGHCLACPLHGAVFDVRDGAVLAEPARTPLRSWPVRVVDGWVELVRD